MREKKGKIRENMIEERENEREYDRRKVNKR